MERKVPRYIEGFGIYTEDKNEYESAMNYRELEKFLLSKSNLVIRKKGKLNK